MRPLLRSFGRNRGFFAVAVTLLGLGIGSATLVFGLVNELLLKPLPVRDPQNLYLLLRTSPEYFRPIPDFSYRFWREGVQTSPVIASSVAETPPEPQYLVPFRDAGATRLLMAQVATTSVNLAIGLANHHKRVLLIDMDPQGNVAHSLKIKTHQNTIYDLLQ